MEPPGAAEAAPNPFEGDSDSSSEWSQEPLPADAAATVEEPALPPPPAYFALAAPQPAPAPPSYSALAPPLEPVAEAPEEPREDEDDAAYESEASSVWSQEPGGPDHVVDEPALPPPPAWDALYSAARPPESVPSRPNPESERERAPPAPPTYVAARPAARNASATRRAARAACAARCTVRAAAARGAPSHHWRRTRSTTRRRRRTPTWRGRWPRRAPT